MFCCALAAFIVCNIAVAFGFVRTRLFGGAQTPQHPENLAVEWSLAAANAGTPAAGIAPALQNRGNTRRRLLSAMAVVLIASVAFSVGFLSPFAAGAEKLAWRYILVTHRNMCSAASTLLSEAR